MAPVPALLLLLFLLLLLLLLLLLTRKLSRCLVALATTRGNGGGKQRCRQLLPIIDLDDAAPNMVTILNCAVLYGLISKTPES